MCHANWQVPMLVGGMWHVACSMCKGKSALKKPQQQTKATDIGL